MKRIPLFLLLTLLLGCQTPRQSMSLLENAATSEPSNLVGPEKELGHDASAQFLSGRWLTDGSVAVALSKPGARAPALRFLVKQKLSLVLLLTAKRHPPNGPAEVALSLNGDPLRRVSLTEEWEPIQIEVEADALVEGENLLAIEGEGASGWKDFQVRPTFPARTLSGESPSLELVKSAPEATLLLPHSQLLEFPLKLPGRGRRLRLSPVTQWLEPGSAPLTKLDLLTVRLRSDQPPFDQTWKVAPGRTTSFRFPDTLSQVTLSFFSAPREKLLKGQLGWKLPTPRLEFLPEAKEQASPLLPPGEPTPTSSPLEEPPNLVLYLVDTLRADHLGCYGYARPTSPNIDALARDGVRFEDVSAHCSWTKPSTATVLTGLHPIEHGVHDHGDMLPENLETLAEILNVQGYQSYAFMANAFASSLFGMMQGFQEELMIKAPSQALHQKIVARLDNLEAGKPFFLYVHSMDPHGPYDPPEAFDRWSKELETANYGELWAQSRRAQIDDLGAERRPPHNLEDVVALYDGEIAANDHSFGLLMEELKQRGLYDNTMVVLLSDHGEEFYEHSSFGHGSSLFQEVLQVPWVIKYPGQTAAGTSVGGRWQHVDVAPTLLSALRIPVPEAMRGLSYHPGAGPPRERPLSAYLHVGEDVRPRQTHRPYLSHLESLRQGTSYYVECFASLRHGLSPRSLYQLSQDPGQQTDLWSKLPVEAAHLRATLRTLHGDKVSPPVEKAPFQTTNDHLRDLQYLR